jgi:hypothetical protein
MPFLTSVKEEALVRSRRCCCVCREFAGVYTNVHHIQQEADEGPDTLDNAIVLCLRCHGEAGHYNPRHPIGNRYSSSELRRHRDTWWAWCRENAGKPLPEYPVSVSPGRIDLGRGSWRATSLVKVYNTSDEPLYQIYVKLRLTSPDIPITSIAIEADHSDRLLSFTLGPLELSATTYRIDGTDESGRKTLYLWLHSLDPKQVKTFLLRTMGGERISEFERHVAEIAIASFDSEPPRVLSRTNEVALPIRSPEGFRTSSVSLVMRRA